MNNTLQKYHKHPNITKKGVMAAILINIIFGTNAIAIKIVVSGIPLFFSIFIRFLLAVCIIYLYCRIKSLKLILDDRNKKGLIILVILSTLKFYLLYYGIKKTYSTHASIIINILPFIVLLFAHFFLTDEKFRLKQFVGISIGFLSVVLLLFDNHNSLIHWGNLIVLLSVIVWGANAIWLKKLLNTMEPYQVVFFQFLYSLPLFFIASVLQESITDIVFNKIIIGTIIYQGSITSAFGFIIWQTLLKKFGVVTLHGYVFIMPVTGVIVGHLLLHEPISSKLILTLCMLITGVFIISREDKLLS